MKKIITLAFMAFFVCLGAMAQVELGDIKFSIADGKKVNPIQCSCLENPRDGEAWWAAVYGVA